MEDEYRKIKIKLLLSHALRHESLLVLRKKNLTTITGLLTGASLRRYVPLQADAQRGQ